jgi:hypothetical protein
MSKSWPSCSAGAFSVTSSWKMATAPDEFAPRSDRPTPRMKNVEAVAPAVRISTFGVTFARSEMFWAPSASIAAASNWVTDEGTSASIAVTARPFTRITSTPAGASVGIGASSTAGSGSGGSASWATATLPSRIARPSTSRRDGSSRRAAPGVPANQARPAKRADRDARTRGLTLAATSLMDPARGAMAPEVAFS